MTTKKKKNTQRLLPPWKCTLGQGLSLSYKINVKSDPYLKISISLNSFLGRLFLVDHTDRYKGLGSLLFYNNKWGIESGGLWPKLLVSLRWSDRHTDKKRVKDPFLLFLFYIDLTSDELNDESHESDKQHFTNYLVNERFIMKRWKSYVHKITNTMRSIFWMSVATTLVKIIAILNISVVNDSIKFLIIKNDNPDNVNNQLKQILTKL